MDAVSRGARVGAGRRGGLIWLSCTLPEMNPIPFAPPILVHDGLVISQTPNIILYLSARVGPIDFNLSDDNAEPHTTKLKHNPATLADASTFHQQAFLLTVLDLANDVRLSILASSATVELTTSARRFTTRTTPSARRIITRIKRMPLSCEPRASAKVARQSTSRTSSRTSPNRRAASSRAKV
jgi:hypothetical protein